MYRIKLVISPLCEYGREDVLGHVVFKNTKITQYYLLPPK